RCVAEDELAADWHADDKARRRRQEVACRTALRGRPRFGSARKGRPTTGDGQGCPSHERESEARMQRSQRTIARAVETSGIGFLTGADVRISFAPAPADHGIAFLRTDCPNAMP